MCITLLPGHVLINGLSPGCYTSDTKGANSGSKTVYPFSIIFHPRFLVLLKSLVFCVVFCRSLFVFFTICFWPCYCLSFDLRLRITPLVSSNLYIVNWSCSNMARNNILKYHFIPCISLEIDERLMDEMYIDEKLIT